MRPVLRDNKLEEEFQREGFVKIQFLDGGEVEDLKKAYFDTLEDSGGLLRSDEITYDFTFIDKNIDYKREVFRIITGKFEPKVAHFLADYKPIIANFIRKKSDGGEVPLHQNWAFVDERKCTSVSIWCPLIDSNEDNGTLQIVPGSHKRYGEFRGPMVPWELDNIKEEIIADCLVPMNIKAGEAIVLDDSVVHYSNINQTEGLRLAIQLILIPEEERSIHYHMDPAVKNRIDVLEVDKEFYMEFNPWKKAENVKKVKTMRYRPFNMSMDAFRKSLYGKRIDESPPPEDGKLFSRIKKVFSS